jgi:hypothetical protein
MDCQIPAHQTPQLASETGISIHRLVLWYRLHESEECTGNVEYSIWLTVDQLEPHRLKTTLL